MAMIRVLLLLAAMTIASGVHAEIFKCTTPDGQTVFSDTPCKAGSSAEVVPDRDHVSKEQQDEARAKLDEQKRELKELEAQRVAAEPPKTTPEAPPPPVVEEVYGVGCTDTVRGRGTNCAEDPYRRPLPDRPIIRPGPRVAPR